MCLCVCDFLVCLDTQREAGWDVGRGGVVGLLWITLFLWAGKSRRSGGIVCASRRDCVSSFFFPLCRSYNYDKDDDPHLCRPPDLKRGEIWALMPKNRTPLYHLGYPRLCFFPPVLIESSIWNRFSQKNTTIYLTFRQVFSENKIILHLGRFCQRFYLTQLPTIHSSIHTPAAESTTASSTGAVGVRSLAQGHLDTVLGGAGDRTSNLRVTSKPAQPPQHIATNQAKLGRVSCSGTARHSAMSCRGLNYQPSGCQSIRYTSWAWTANGSLLFTALRTELIYSFAPNWSV